MESDTPVSPVDRGVEKALTSDRLKRIEDDISELRDATLKNGSLLGELVDLSRRREQREIERAEIANRRLWALAEKASGPLLGALTTIATAGAAWASGLFTRETP